MTFFTMFMFNNRSLTQNLNGLNQIISPIYNLPLNLAEPLTSAEDEKTLAAFPCLSFPSIMPFVDNTAPHSFTVDPLIKV